MFDYGHQLAIQNELEIELAEQQRISSEVKSLFQQNQQLDIEDQRALLEADKQQQKLILNPGTYSTHAKQTNSRLVKKSKTKKPVIDREALFRETAESIAWAHKIKADYENDIAEYESQEKLKKEIQDQEKKQPMNIPLMAGAALAGLGNIALASAMETEVSKRKHDEQVSDPEKRQKVEERSIEQVVDDFLYTASQLQKDRPLGRALKILAQKYPTQPHKINGILGVASVKLEEADNKKVARILNNIVQSPDSIKEIERITSHLVATPQDWMMADQESGIDGSTLRKIKTVRSLKRVVSKETQLQQEKDAAGWMGRLPTHTEEDKYDYDEERKVPGSPKERLTNEGPPVVPSPNDPTNPIQQIVTANLELPKRPNVYVVYNKDGSVKQASLRPFEEVQWNAGMQDEKKEEIDIPAFLEKHDAENENKFPEIQKAQKEYQTNLEAALTSGGSTGVGGPSTFIPPPLSEPDVIVNPSIAPMDKDRIKSSFTWDVSTGIATAAASAYVYSQVGPVGAAAFANAMTRLLQVQETDQGRNHSDQIGSQIASDFIQRGSNLLSKTGITSHAEQILNPLVSQTDSTRTSLTVQDIFAKNLTAGNQIAIGENSFRKWYTDLVTPYAIATPPS